MGSNRRKLFQRSNRITLAALLFPLIICTIVSLPIFAEPSLTYGQTENTPAFQDTFWTENAVVYSSESSNASTKKEVGPGDGTSTLAIVLVNKARSELTGLTGYLRLPSGFAAIRGENNVTSTDTAVASHTSIIRAGASFTLYFTIDVLKEAKVGAYIAPLELSYSKVLDLGQISSIVNVPFRLPGKVILDAILLSQNLIAGSPNELKILIKNEGSADANGATITINDVTEGTANVALGDTIDDIDTGSSESTSNNTALAESGKAENDGQSTSQFSAVSLGIRTFNVGSIPAGGLTTIRPIVYPSYSSGGTIQTLDLEISYNDAYGIRKTEAISIGIVISPNPPESVLSLSPYNKNTKHANNTNEIDNQGNDSILLTAGKIEDLRLLLSNNGETSLENLVLSLDSPSDSVEILENSRWTLNSLPSSGQKILSTQVFAAEDAIASPIEFTIDAEYISGGQSKTDSLGIGAYIDGEIKIEAYDFAVNDIGGTPNLVGNLLNQGNTVALFTTVKLLNNDQTILSREQQSKHLVTDPSTQQYLGDLSENSPLPFSIPISIDKDTPRGTYPVSIKVDYVDNLRNPHTLVLNGTVNYTPEQTEPSDVEVGFLGLDQRMLLAVLALVLLLIAGLLFFFIKKRKKGKAKEETGGSDENKDKFGLFGVGSLSHHTEEIDDRVNQE